MRVGVGLIGVLEVAPEATEMVILSIAPEAGVEMAADSVVVEGTIEGGGPTVTVTVFVEGA